MVDHNTIMTIVFVIDKDIILKQYTAGIAVHKVSLWWKYQNKNYQIQNTAATSQADIQDESEAWTANAVIL